MSKEGKGLWDLKKKVKIIKSHEGKESLDIHIGQGY